MSEDAPDTEDAKEARQHGEKPDHGHTPDALREALSGTDSGSDTRAGSLEGGSASGSDVDPDLGAINEALASEGMTDETDAQPDDDADAATS